MKRLTETDKYGNWGLREIPWKNLYTGTPITWETYEALYGALHKLKDYEDSGLSPDGGERASMAAGQSPLDSGERTVARRRDARLGNSKTFELDFRLWL